jgi:two-component sensor histidine kinase
MASNIALSHRVWPLHGGQTGALVRIRDWSTTTLGNSAEWPERFRAAVDNCLDAPFPSFVWWGPELIQLYNDAALPIVQSQHPAVFGVPAREAWPDVWPTVEEIVERVMSTGRPAPCARIVLMTAVDGPAPINFSCSALRDAAGDAAGVLLTASDKADTVCVPPPHRDPALRDAVEGILSCAFDAPPSATNAVAVRGNTLACRGDLIVQEDGTAAPAGSAGARSGRAMTYEYPTGRLSDGKVRCEPNSDFRRATGARHIRAVRGFHRHLNSATTAAGGVAVTAAELQHHTRNLIAVVRAIISHTLATSPSPDEFWRRIDDRLRALARVQGLLSRSDEEPITIGALVRLEFDGGEGSERAQQQERVDIAGPAVRLRNSIVQTLALALHELATNARKYGALSTGGGQLRIGWQLEQREAAPWLVLNWAEKQVRQAGAPPDRKGYGREFIEHALSYSHGAQTRFELDEMGLRCSIALPLGTDGNEERRT